MKQYSEILLSPKIEEIKDRIFKKKSILVSKRPLSPMIMAKLQDDFSLEWTYNSNSIEGNTLTIAETRIILENGITVGGKSLREHFEVLNHHKAISFLENMITENKIQSVDLLDIHQIVLSNILDDYTGRFRSSMIRIVGANFVPPSAKLVSDLMDELVSFVNDNICNYDIVTLASLFHHRFVWIHPFYDGNGRTVRLAMNLLLMKAGFPPAIILVKDRKKYILALNAANNGNFEKLFLVVFQAVERSLNIYLASIDSKYDNYEPLQNIAKEPSIPYDQEYLSLLARQGRIDAYKEGRIWYSSKNAVSQYLKAKLK